MFTQTKEVIDLHVQVANKNYSCLNGRYREMHTDKTRKIIKD